LGLSSTRNGVRKGERMNEDNKHDAKEYENKVILDVACGPKLFWFNKKHPRVLYNDLRTKEKGYNSYRPNREIKPDTNFDFRN